MGAGHKEKITTASDVMSGLRLSLSRRRTIELGLAVGMAFSAPGVRAAEEPPEVFFSPEVSADALILIYEKLSGDLSGRVGIKIHGGEAAVNLPLFRALQAHIPEKYIGDLNQRLEIYRRIADIRTQEDALDVTDELIDRFGEPPESVNGLISIALLRNQASRLGIHEVKQQNDTLLFYKQKVDPRQVALLVSTFKKRVMINAGARPYISVKLSGSPLDTLSEVLALLSGAENQPPEKQ